MVVRAGAGHVTVEHDGGRNAQARATEAGLLSEAISDAQDRLAQCSQLAKALNLPGACVFIEGGRGNLRHAATELHWAISQGSVRGGLIRLREFGIGLRRSEEKRGIAVRQRLAADGSAEDASTADGEEGAPLPNLVIDLLNDEAVSQAARRPVFAALLANALSSHTWLHRGSRTIWSEGAGGARMAAAILAGGRHFPDLSHADLGGIVDGEVADLLARCGWVRLDSPVPPGSSARQGA